MIERIYAIPLAESLEQHDRCPLCFLEKRSDVKMREDILGMAKMEPDIRTRTNTEGFCGPHLAALLAAGQRQSLSLLLQSLFWEVKNNRVEQLQKLGGRCYLCARIEAQMGHFYENFVWLWKQDEDFRQKSGARDDLCLTHSVKLLETGRRLLPKKESARFSAHVWGAIEGRIDAISEHLDAFCQSMDYRNAERPLDEAAKGSLEEAALFLGGRSL